jgi:hypothetical protein
MFITDEKFITSVGEPKEKRNHMEDIRTDRITIRLLILYTQQDAVYKVDRITLKLVLEKLCSEDIKWIHLA